MTTPEEPLVAEVKASRLFATTQWSLVQAAGDPGSPEATAALEQLCQRYVYPVYAYVRRWGHGVEDARDLSQEFFARLLRDNTLAAADRERGRFRSFLLGVLKRFLLNERVHARAQKRGGGAAAISWEQDLVEERFVRESSELQSPDEMFDRKWATTVLEHALVRLEAEFVELGRPRLFQRLKPFVLGDRGHPSWREVGAEFALSEGAIKSALRRLRVRYGEIVRAEIAATLNRREEVDEELKHLLAVMSR